MSWGDRRNGCKMLYVDKILEPGEQVRYIGRLHWLIYLPTICFGLGAGLLLALSAVNPNYGHYIFGVGIVVLLLSPVVFIPEWLRRLTTEIAVTDRRVVLKSGIIRRHSIEMNMDKIESVDVDQSVLGRIFDFGTVIIRGTGASLEPLYKIANPLRLRSQITAR